MAALSSQARGSGRSRRRWPGRSREASQGGGTSYGRRTSLIWLGAAVAGRPVRDAAPGTSESAIYIPGETGRFPQTLSEPVLLVDNGFFAGELSRHQQPKGGIVTNLGEPTQGSGRGSCGSSTVLTAHGFLLTSATRISPGTVDHRLAVEVVSRQTAPSQSPRPDPYGVTVLTSTGCNLACPYCFQNTGSADTAGISPRIADARLAVEDVPKIIAFVKRQVEKLEKDAVVLHLFGGEPLQAFSACEALLSQFHQSLPTTNASMQTNGVLLTARRARVLEDAGLQLVHVTFDGRGADHDALRYRKDRGATYRSILRNIRNASNVTNLKWSIRINVSASNVGHISELLDDIAEVAPIERTRPYLALLRDYGLGVGPNLASADAIKTQLIGAQQHLLDLGFAARVYSGDQPCVFCDQVGGGSGAVIGPDGRLYSCWDVAGHDESCVGDIANGYLTDKRLVEGRWAACAADLSDTVAFNAWQETIDQVDAFTLDWMLSHGVLSSKSETPAGKGTNTRSRKEVNIV